MNKLAHSNIDTFLNTILDRTKILQLKIVNTKTARRWSSRIGDRGLVGSTFGDAANAAYRYRSDQLPGRSWGCRTQTRYLAPQSIGAQDKPSALERPRSL